MNANAEVKEEVKRKYGSAARAVAERGKWLLVAIQACAAATRSPPISIAPMIRG